MRTAGAVAVAAAAALAAIACSSADAPAGSASDDGGADARPSKDAAPAGDDGGDDGPLASCPADDPTGYAAAWHPPAPAHAACTAAELDAFDAQFLGPGETTATRAQFAADHPACFQCLVTDDASATWGALVRFNAFGGWYSGNLSGCVALREGDASATSCGAAVEADLMCRYTSCGKECHPTNASELDAFNACFVPAASTTTCAPFASAALACLRDGGESPCEQSSYPDFRAYARALGELFCTSD
jgi:hypothetical protein